MKTICKFLPVVLLSHLCQVGDCQPDSSGAHVSFKAGVNYNSVLHYYGRTDSVKSSGVFPLVEVWLNKKWYVSAAPVFTFSKSSRLQYAGTVTTAGFIASSRRHIVHVYAAKPFYKSHLALPQSILKAQVAGSFTLLSRFINLTVGGDLKFSDRPDVGLSAGLDHLIRTTLTGRSTLFIDPSFYVYAGTRRFTRTFYERKSFLIFPGSVVPNQEEVNNFNILSCELSAPVMLSSGKWLFTLTPAVVTPANMVAEENETVTGRKAKAMFYVTTGIKFSL